MIDQRNHRDARVRVGLAVVFAALGQAERDAIQAAWEAAATIAAHWEPAFRCFGLCPLSDPAERADILVYLGESSRFAAVAGQASERRPVVFVKSTVEELLGRGQGAAPRYRMCTGVRGIVKALASVAPAVPTVDWQALPWPKRVADLVHIDRAEQTFVDASVAAFRQAAAERDIAWLETPPIVNDAFSVFLPMHDPTASSLASVALRLWPRCSVLAGDGMVISHPPSRAAWPSRLFRARHWSAHIDSESNRRFQRALAGVPLPDLDSAGMLFGTLRFLDGAFGQGVPPARLEAAATCEGPLGPVQMLPSGRPEPERVVICQGAALRVVAA